MILSNVAAEKILGCRRKTGWYMLICWYMAALSCVSFPVVSVPTGYHPLVCLSGSERPVEVPDQIRIIVYSRVNMQIPCQISNILIVNK